jgi:probable HAF family extracellular repeat protein
MKIKHSLIAATLLTTASFSSFAAPSYKLTDLGVIQGGDFSYAYGISNTGLVTGRSRGRIQTGSGTDTRATTHAARFFTDGSGYVQDLGSLGGSRGAAGKAINNAGMVAGYSTINTADGSRVYNAFVNHYKSGYMQNIGTLGNGKESRAYGINNNGKVVGWSNTQANGSDHKAFVYDTASSTMSALQGPLLGGSRSFAFDINDSDQIVGTATTANGSANAFIYKNGLATSIGSLDDSGYSEARAVNENGAVTGWSLDANNNYTAYLYDDASGMQSLGGFGGDSKGYDVNIHGDVVGSAKDADGNSLAFLYKNGHMYNLFDLLSAADQALWKELREGFSINDDGIIVGRGRFWTDKDAGRSSSRAFMLNVSAVPLPGAIFLMGPALGLLGFMGKRRSQAVA